MADRYRASIGFARFLGWVVSIVAFWFVIKWLLSVDHRAWSQLLHFDWWWLIFSLACFQLWFILRYVAWEYISRRHGYDAARHENLRMWILSELMRYIPGNIWSFAGRYRGARQGGTTRASTLQALLVEASGLLSGATVVTLCTLHHWWWLAPIVAVFVVLAGPSIIRVIFRIAKQETTRVTRQEALVLLVMYSAIWLVFGVAHIGLFQAMKNILGPSSAMVAISISVFSWFIGYLTIITPMGLGVREAVFTKSLQSALEISSSTASLVAILSRVWMVVSEVFFLLLVLGWTTWRNVATLRRHE